MGGGPAVAENLAVTTLHLDVFVSWHDVAPEEWQTKAATTRPRCSSEVLIVMASASPAPTTPDRLTYRPAVVPSVPRSLSGHCSLSFSMVLQGSMVQSRRS